MSFNGNLYESDEGLELSTKAQIHTHDSSSNTALNVSGNNGYLLSENSGTSTGLEWITAPAGLTETTGLSASNYASVYSGSSQAIGVNSFMVGGSLDPRMPTGQKFLQCVALECKIGSVASGNFRLSLWCRSSLRGKLSLMAWCPEASASAFGTDTIAKISTIGSGIITPATPTNQDYFLSIISDDATFTCYTLGGTGLGYGVTYDAETPTTTGHDVANSWQQVELKAYFTGYS